MATGNAINADSAGLVRYDGAGTFTGVTTTQHDLLIGAASNGITNVAPSATSGVPVISQGSSADPTFGTAVVAGGGTGLTSATAYAVICGGTTTTGAFQSIASVGTSGQVLTSNGAGALPTFQTGGSGNLVLIQTQTASNSASLTFTSGITGTYNNYFFIWSNVKPVTNAVDIELLWSTNGGSTYVTTGYASGLTNIPYNTNTFANVNTTSYMYLVQNATNASAAGKGYAYLFDLTSGAAAFMFGTTAGNAGTYQITQSSNTTASINALKVVASSGNISTGTFSLYGILP